MLMGVIQDKIRSKLLLWVRLIRSGCPIGRTRCAVDVKGELAAAIAG